MNLVVTLRITQMNPLQTKMSKEGSPHQRQITQLHNHNSHHPRKAARRTPSSMDQQSTEKRVPRAVLQGLQVTSHKDQPLQHPQHKLEDHHRAPPVTKPSTSHQDPPERNDTNGSTKAPTNGKGPGATKSKKTLTNTSPATQPSDSSKNTIICSQCGESGHWSRKLST